MPSFAVVHPVGPKPTELARTADLVESLGACESSPGWFVMIDDTEVPRELDKVLKFPPHITPVAIHHRRTRKVKYGNAIGVCSPVLHGMEWIQQNTTADFAMKLDTDSLIIGPFVEKVVKRFAEQPHAGFIGAASMDPNGQPRDIAAHGRNVMKLYKPPIVWSKPRETLRRLFDKDTSFVRPIIRKALANGYTPGEHCLGGGYAIRKDALDRMAQAGYLDSPSRWLVIDWPEEVMMGLLTRAVGYTLENFASNGDPFGVKYKGLPDTPERMIERGYSVIHSVKNDPRATEEEIREFFRRRRSHEFAARTG